MTFWAYLDQHPIAGGTILAICLLMGTLVALSLSTVLLDVVTKRSKP